MQEMGNLNITFKIIHSAVFSLVLLPNGKELVDLLAAGSPVNILESSHDLVFIS